MIWVHCFLKHASGARGVQGRRPDLRFKGSGCGDIELRARCLELSGLFGVGRTGEVYGEGV